jgi:hypothetical protein
MGIFGGHVFHFFREVWPSMGGKKLLETPRWMTKTFKGPDRPPGGSNEASYKGHVTDYRKSSSDKKTAPKRRSLSKVPSPLRKVVATASSSTTERNKKSTKKKARPLGSTSA